MLCRAFLLVKNFAERILMEREDVRRGDSKEVGLTSAPKRL
jgi:hypothetical protein